MIEETNILAWSILIFFSLLACYLIGGQRDQYGEPLTIGIINRIGAGLLVIVVLSGIPLSFFAVLCAVFEVSK